MRKIKVVVLLVQQLQHGFTKNAKVSPNLTVAHILKLRTRIQNSRIGIISHIYFNNIDHLSLPFSFYKAFTRKTDLESPYINIVT